MTENPLVLLLMMAGIAYGFSLWLKDYREQESTGEPRKGGFPGAWSCPGSWVWFGVFGAIALTLLETLGEIGLGISDEQSDITILFGFYILFAAILEELVFRGYLLITGKGRSILWLSVLGFSVIFTLAHPFFWTWEDGSLEFHFTLKAWFSSSVVFVNSLFFYWLRISARNPKMSLIPCFAAHFASNLAVFAIKGAQGHVVGLW